MYVSGIQGSLLRDMQGLNSVCAMVPTSSGIMENDWKKIYVAWKNHDI